MKAKYRDATWLRLQYWHEGKSQRQIANEMEVSKTTIAKWMRRFNIPRRHGSAAYLARGKRVHPQLHDETWLKNAYIHEDRTLSDIANELNVGLATVHRHLKNFSIHKGKTRPFHFKQWLKRAYMEEGRSLVEIARKQGVSVGTIQYWMNRHRLSARTHSEANHLAQGNLLRLSPYATYFLDDELLGDGSLSRTSTYSSYYSHNSKHKGYLEWLGLQLQSMGIEPLERIQRVPSGFREDRFGYRLKTKSYDGLKALRDRWYNSGSKTVPNDIEVSPVTVRQWYIGDGSLVEQRGRHHLTLHTLGFTFEDTELLIHKLADVGIECTLETVRRNGRSYPKIYVRMRSLKDFFAYIGPCPPEISHIYGYKWRQTGD